MAISQVFYVQTPSRQGLWVLQALPTGRNGLAGAGSLSEFIFHLRIC